MASASSFASAQEASLHPASLELSLDMLAANYSCLGNALEALHAALMRGDATAMAEATRTVAGLTHQTRSVVDELLPVVPGQEAPALSLIERIREAANAAASTIERERLMSAAELLAVRMNRVLETRARIGTLAADLADANQQMLDVVRQLDGRGATYDRTFNQRGTGRARGVLDTSA